MAVDFKKKLKLKFKTNLNFSCQAFVKFNHFEDDSARLIRKIGYAQWF